MRRRPNPSNDDDHPVEYLDQDDQEKLIQQIRQEAAKQELQIYNLFRFICIAVAIIDVLAAILVQRRQRTTTTTTTAASSLLTLFRWIHTSLSVWLHLSTPQVIVVDNVIYYKWSRKVYKPIAAGSVLLASIALYFARKEEQADSVHLHQAFVLGNAIVIASGVWLKWDGAKSTKAIEELDASKYRYKSL